MFSDDAVKTLRLRNCQVQIYAIESALQHSQNLNSIMSHVMIKNGKAWIMADNSQNSLLKAYVGT